MCSMYWSVWHRGFKCPACGVVGDWDLQTHYEGEPGDCSNFYEMNQQIPNLHGLRSATLTNDFIGDCPKCKKFLDFDGEVKNATIVAFRVSEIQPSN